MWRSLFFTAVDYLLICEDDHYLLPCKDDLCKDYLYIIFCEDDHFFLFFKDDNYLLLCEEDHGPEGSQSSYVRRI